jgi:Cof subfamily protein (haloacid dehalogenase superfamily)
MPSSRYKLLLSDLDGTLLDFDGKIHERDRKAIEELLANGVRVSLCTGRMYSGTRAVARALGLDTPVGCVDGSHIVHALDDRELSHSSIGHDGAALLFDILSEFRPITFVFAEDSVFHDESGLDFVPYVKSWSERIHALKDVLAESRVRHAGTVTGMVSLGTADQIRAAEARIREEGGPWLQTVTFALRRLAGTWGMVIRAAGVSKGTALEWIARHHGIEASEVVAVGDWLNDIPMLRVAGRSFAMNQAPDEVKAAATDVLDADVSTGGGIAEAAERAGLL